MLKLFAVVFILFLSVSQASNLRIIGGSQVSLDDTKWDFIVSVRNVYLCGGSLIAPQWVLTAAHCWYDVALDTDTDRVGINNHSLNEQTLYPIEEVFIHPNYNSDTMDNDLTLLKLTTPVTAITPTSLDYSSTLPAGLESWVAGWGNTDTTTTEGNYPTDLMQVIAPIVDFNDCNASYGILTKNMICAGYMQGEKDSCQGDSGGPLISENNGKWVQSGIVSWGYNCAEPNYPGVYTKVQNYIPWIESHTGKLNDRKNLSLSPIINYLLN